MHDVIETVAVLLSVAIVFGPVIGFVLFIRHMARKEKAALREYGLLEDLEV